MNLGDLLAITNDMTSVYVYDEDGIVAYYDGKNSIDEKFNTKRVVEQWVTSYRLNIRICTD